MHLRAHKPPQAMSLSYFNMMAVTVCCLLLLGGYAARERQPGILCMLAGVAGLLTVIGFNIYASLHGWPWG